MANGAIVHASVAMQHCRIHSSTVKLGVSDTAAQMVTE